MTGNVFLVGLMGAGKTTVGRVLARHLDKTFVDADHELEARTGVRIPLIFELEGEAGFRQREAKLLAELVARKNIVLATGGGVVLEPENRAALKNHGVVVYLDASIETLWARTRHDKNRPLLQVEDPYGKLLELYKVRDPLYREIADIVVPSGSRGVSNVVRAIETRLAEFGILPPSPRASTDANPHR